MAEIMFEQFNSPSIFFMPTNVLSLFSTGKKSGLVIDSGHDVTNVLPVFEGYAIRESLETELYGGKAITDSLKIIYEDRDPLIKGNFDVIHKVKELYACVSPNPTSNFSTSNDGKLFSLPDDQKIRLGEELMRIPEQIFSPVPQGYCKRSIQELVETSVESCDEDLK